MKRKIAISLAIATGLVFSTYSFSNEGGYTCPSQAIIVSQGDTITSLVHALCEGNTRRAIDDTYETYGSVIMPSQQIYLPSGK